MCPKQTCGCSVKKTCIACISNCLQCSNPTSCDICDTGYVLNNGICIKPTVTCQANEYMFENKCYPTCPNGAYSFGKMCNCRCKKNYYYSGQYNKCYSSCPYGTTLSEYGCI